MDNTLEFILGGHLLWLHGGTKLLNAFLERPLPVQGLALCSFIFLSELDDGVQRCRQVLIFADDDVINQIFVILLLLADFDYSFCAKLLMRFSYSVEKELHNGLFFLEGDVAYLLAEFDDQVLQIGRTEQADFVSYLKLLHLLLIDLLVKALKLGSSKLFAHCLKNGQGGILLTVNGVHLVNDVFHKLIHLPLVLENQVYFSGLESQADALP